MGGKECGVQRSRGAWIWPYCSSIPITSPSCEDPCPPCGFMVTLTSLVLLSHPCRHSHRWKSNVFVCLQNRGAMGAMTLFSPHCIPVLRQFLPHRKFVCSKGVPQVGAAPLFLFSLFPFLLHRMQTWWLELQQPLGSWFAYNDRSHILRVAKQEETGAEDMQTLLHQPGLPPTKLVLIKQTLMI